MLKLKRLLICIAVGLSLLPAVAQSRGLTRARLEPETLQYRVMFKWGLINKKAGTATLSLNNDKRTYTAMLTAKSESWADKFYRVRDTLNGRMTYSDFTPLLYEKIAHEGNEYKHDVVTYNYKRYPQILADCTRKVYKKGQLKIDESRQLTSEVKAVDMLTSFYYMRTLPYESWQPGHVETIDIFSGKRKELLSIIYGGIVDLEIDEVVHKTYRITFKFTSNGGKKTSDDMDAWISVDDQRIPLRLEGKLPVGKVHCILDK